MNWKVGLLGMAPGRLLASYFPELQPHGTEAGLLQALTGPRLPG